MPKTAPMDTAVLDLAAFPEFAMGGVGGRNGRGESSQSPRPPHADAPVDDALFADPPLPPLALSGSELIQRPFRRTRDKVAFVGFAPHTRHLAPHENDDYEIWGINEAYSFTKDRRVTRWFQLHGLDALAKSQRDPDSLGWLERSTAPVYMLRRYATIPASVAYPLDVMTSRFKPYFTSTLGYMTALALAMGFTTIAVYGVDMANDAEYWEQRPNFEYLLGIAQGLGVQVILPDDCCLLKAGNLYGYDPEGPINRDTLQARSDQLQAEIDRLKARLSEMEGRNQEIQGMMFGLAAHERGSPSSWGADLPKTSGRIPRVGGVRGVLTPVTSPDPIKPTLSYDGTP